MNTPLPTYDTASTERLQQLLAECRVRIEAGDRRRSTLVKAEKIAAILAARSAAETLAA